MRPFVIGYADGGNNRGGGRMGKSGCSLRDDIACRLGVVRGYGVRLGVRDREKDINPPSLFHT